MVNHAGRRDKTLKTRTVSAKLGRMVSLAVQRASSYPNLLVKIPRYCCSVEIFWFGIFFYRDMTEIYNYMPRSPSRARCPKVSFPRAQQYASRF